jgi:hypothetical protein
MALAWAQQEPTNQLLERNNIMAVKAIFKKAYHFTKDRITDQKTADGVIPMRIVETEIRIKPGLQPQVVEDWVKDTLLYKNGVTDHLIVEV